METKKNAKEEPEKCCCCKAKQEAEIEKQEAIKKQSEALDMALSNTKSRKFKDPFETSSAGAGL